jgi:hypothetical protein
MSAFADTKTVARKATAKQPKLHLDTSAEALRVLGFQLGENIKTSSGYVSPNSTPTTESRPRASSKIGS